MITIRPSAERGQADLGWLRSFHTFSFADYYDPRHMHFRSLRVINEDWVAPGKGFGTHPHDNMEIVTYVLEGTLEHKDSLGTGSLIRPGEVQRMSAGTGLTHSEFNPSPAEPVHLLQIWLLPARRGLPPSYEQKAFPAEGRRNRLALVAAPGGADGALTIQQDVRLYAGLLDSGRTLTHELADGRHAWLQVARGALTLNGHPLQAGDGAAVSQESRLDLAATQNAEFLLFDLA